MIGGSSNLDVPQDTFVRALVNVEVNVGPLAGNHGLIKMLFAEHVSDTRHDVFDSAFVNCCASLGCDVHAI